MKKPPYILIAVSAILMGNIGVCLAQTAVQPAIPAQKTNAAAGQVVPSAPAAISTSKVPVTAPIPPKAPTAPVATMQTPVSPQIPSQIPAKITPQVPQAAAATNSVAAPAAATPSSAAALIDKIAPLKPVAAAGVEDKSPKKGAPEDLRNAMSSGEFMTKLSFPLQEQQMVEFARAAVKVNKINSKWDVQIAGAETDQMAIEYNNLAVEEIEHALKNIPGLTLDQYNELTRMTTTDKEFNSIYLAYKQLVSQGAFGTPPKGGALPSRPAAPVAGAPVNYGTSSAPVTGTGTGKSGTAAIAGNNGVALPNATNMPATAVAPKPTSIPANSDIVPVPPGSPKPPYSPPATR